jgi:mannosyltransferase
MGAHPVLKSPYTIRTCARKGLFPAIFLAAFLLRLVNLGKQSLWFDETYTAFVARQPFERMMQFLVTDGVHPPLYYWGMAAWIRIFGTSEWSLRLPSAIAGGLAVWMLYLLVRRMGGEPEALLSAALLGASPFLLWYSQDARMYSLECLAAVAAAFSLWTYLHKPSAAGFLGLILAHVFLYGLHYFGVFLFMAECMFLILFWREYYRLWISYLIAQAAAFLPLILWGVTLLHRENGSFGISWIPKSGWTDPALTVINFFTANGGTWNLAAAAAGILLILLFGFALGRGRFHEGASFGLFWLVIPVLMAWFLSLQIPIYIDRYLILCLPAAVALASIGAFSIRGRKRWVAPVLLLATMLPGLWNLTRAADGFHKEDWRAAAESIRTQYGKGDVILVRVFQEAVPLDYYGLLDLPWSAIETNLVVTLPDVDPAAKEYFLVYWIPSQSAHSFGTKTPDSYAEIDPEVAEWLDCNFITLRVENYYHGIVILILEPQRR